MAARLLIAFGVLIALLHLLDTRNPRTQLVSEYAFELPVLAGIAFVLLGAGIAVVAAELWRVRWLSRPPAVVLALCAAGFAALAVVQTDHEGTDPASTDEGRLHDVLASSGALGLTLGSLLAWLTVRPKAAAVFFVAVNAAFWIPAVLAQDSPGLFQRTWLGAVIAGLLPLSAAARARSGARTGSVRVRPGGA